MRATRLLAAAIGGSLAAAGCGPPETETSPGTGTETGPEMEAEAGFLELEPVSYAVRGGEIEMDAVTSRARLFYSFHPADEAPEDKPLVILTSGGPGASTAILLGGNTAPMTLDPARTGADEIAPNPASWTRFASTLHLDARGTGFSYGLAEGAADPDVRAKELSVRNFNSFVDAADLVRATLRFLESHEALRGAPVVLCGESYSGVRTSIALHMLHHPERYGAGAEPFEDGALAAEIAAHFEGAGTSAAEQMGRAVLLQPRLSSPAQQAAAGAALEAPGSLIFDVAEETGVPFVPCADKPAPCSPFANVLEYLAAAGRDVYDVRKPAGDAFATFDALGARLAKPEVLAQMIGREPADIPEMAPAARAEAYRLKDAAPLDEPLTAELGALAPFDRYFAIELFDLLGEPFAGAEAKGLGVERQHARYGYLFLEDALDVRFFVTNAAFDAAIWTPALPEALALHDDVVSGVHIDGDDLVLDFVDGAFGAAPGASRRIRFAPYGDAGHSVSFDQPGDLAADVGQWLGSAD